MKKVFINSILLCTSILVVNLFILAFFNFLFKQKFISQKLLKISPISKSFLYPDTYKSLDSYNLIIGDSHVFGVGDSLLNLDYDYSIGHLLSYKLTV